MHHPGPGRFHPGAVHFVRTRLQPLIRLAHRPTLTGAAHLPTDRPFLLVANHSAGIGMAELLSFAVLYIDQVGPERPLAAFAHTIGFRFPPLRALHGLIGSVPSTYEAAADALGRGVPLLVFPGGDHESLTPIWLAGRVDFGGRQGFLKIARQAGVPIVPMGISGGAFTAPILLRARWLSWVLLWPRLQGLKRWGISVLGVLGVVLVCQLPLPWGMRLLLAWGCLALPVSFLHWVPWTLRFRIGPPLEPDVLLADGLDAALSRVEAAVQALVSSRE